MAFKGVLIPIGGNEDKGKDKHDDGLDFLKEGILSQVVSESGGLNAYILVVTTASRIPKEVGANYLTAFGLLGCSNVEVLDIRKSEEAEEAELLEKVRKADCMMFSGGDQSRIVDIIGGTEMHKILNYRFQNEEIVIAGTSAGAMAMSSEMISGGSSTESMLKGSVDMRHGMSFIPGLIIDSHFIKRGRFGRLTEAVANFPHLLGVGLAEDTGLIIKNCNHITVIGSGMAIFFDPSSLTHNNVEILPDHIPLTLTNLTVHVLASGDSFEIDEKKITVQGINEAMA